MKSHYQNSKYISFGDIKQLWLRDAVKQWVKIKAVQKIEFHSIQRYVYNLKSFSQFLLKNYPKINNFEDISRTVIVKYLSVLNQKKLSASTITSNLVALKNFFELGLINNFFTVNPYLIRPEDSPRKYTFLPRYIPEEVIKQLLSHLDKLPSSVMRMVLVLLECGLRYGELVSLTIDCLEQDSKGNWSIRYLLEKTNQEIIKPISNEIAAIIQEQQRYIRDCLGAKYNKLFCACKQGAAQLDFRPTPKVMNIGSFSRRLNKLAKEYQITDINGKIWRFQTHQFRHTVATRMINEGVPLPIIQKYLGHKSPEMTMTYAHIHDQTMRAHIDKFHGKVVNISGETIMVNSSLDNNQDLQWMRHNVLAQALPNGSCARPIIKGACPHANACLTCNDFRTTIEFLNQHKEQHKHCIEIIDNARSSGWERQVEMNEKVLENLEKIITSLEKEHE
ncbi:MAG: tyrosine-type recombinase/integrase [Rivularia sp. T60_A2020_040]|nr:tyrosine-type recombinase/integrase [Rivularia sp. T60_A2020_040]